LNSRASAILQSSLVAGSHIRRPETSVKVNRRRQIMQEYKFYFLDERRHVFRAQDHLLPDDISAVECARASTPRTP
jgi:hypothetical protein